MTSNSPLLICVVGPTAIGKTALSIEIARAFSTEIISADSRQFYKEMNIGTAVPSSEELAEVPHHFIQNKSIHEEFSVGDFEKEVLLKLDDLFQKHEVVVMVGGSGLYVDAVVKGLDEFPEVAPHIRDSLNAELQSNGIEVLQKELQMADPAYYAKVDIFNPHRLIRALEIFRSTGKPYSSFLNKDDISRSFETLFIGLTAERETVYARINERVEQMIAGGLLEEAKDLFQYKELNALQTVGYKELFRFFEGHCTKEEAISEIKKNTRRFAKRQATWFRKNKEIVWYDIETLPETIIGFIKARKAR
jgi:tRNA dimethylallyltransferase